MKLVSLRFLIFCLMLTTGSSVLAGEILVTNSGKILRDWSINRVTRNRVEIIHENGVTWFPHSAIPAEILQKYANQIRQKQESHLKQQGSIIKQSVAKALQAETTQAEIDRLVKIQEKYPNHPEISEVEQLIAQKQKRLSVQKAITDSYEEETTEEQIAALQKILEEKVDDDLAVQIDQAIKERKKNLAKSVETIEKSIQIAAAQEDYKQSITALENILKKYPQYPVAAQQQTYQSKVNRLIAEKKEKLKNLQKKIAERMNRYVREPPDTQNQLLTFFKHEAAVDRTKGEKILLATAKLSDAIKTAQNQNNEEAVRTLNTALANSEDAVNKAEAEQVKKFIQEKISLQKISSRAAGDSAQLSIQKKINPRNLTVVFIFPYSRREEINNFYQKISDIASATSIMNDEGEDAETKVLARFTRLTLHNSVDSFLFNEIEESKKNADTRGTLLFKIPRPEASIGLSGIQEHVVLLAVEQIKMNDFKTFQAWYLEYDPGHSSNQWILE